MEQKTRGIILQKIKYKDSASILHVYTREFGREAYIVYTGKSKKSTLKNVFTQPFFVLEMEVTRRNNASIHRMKELRPVFPVTDMLVNPLKMSIAMFLSEILYRILKDTQKDAGLFDFLEESAHILELLQKDMANFHLVFLMQLTRYLGYYPDMETYRHEKVNYFDLQSGVFSPDIPTHKEFLPADESEAFSRLTRMNYENMRFFAFSRIERVQVLRRILQYYRLHLPEFPEIKSLDILQAMFD